MTLTIQQINNQALNILNKEFASVYANTYRTKYHLKYSYGKYKIYKSEYNENLQRRNTTTLASGLDKVTAQGMMKLLEDTE
jgi:hypothetical protein